MADEKAYGRCPKCGGTTFMYFDAHPLDDYPDPYLECTACKSCFKEMELKGIEWIEVPF